MTAALAPVLSTRPQRTSRILAHWRGDRFSLNALGGQVGTFSRPATATPLDATGASRTVSHHQPAWEQVDWDGNSVRETTALLLGASDRFYLAFDPLPQAMTLYAEFVEKGTITMGGPPAIAYVGNTGNTGARFWIDSTGTFYRVRHDNGSGQVTATLAAAPSVGQRVALRATLDDSGRVQLHQSINGAAETSTSQSGTNNLAASWSLPRLYFNSTGDSNNGVTAMVRVRVAAGSQTAAQMAASW